ncbi:C2H2 and C2HC zinc fingers superfamily protein [Raphanus sativus]|uniref:Zinc finger CCCH domain-containing protein 3 n=1 Tax=Raphanus sativus TaxID=3726 RepID=A0A6J0MG12_RAPSA|nr:zinc finger CCCH domain-containing protein 3 [Raphanus sativus]KAJ4877648.1 C2H2 and C2HC zinc fingers superfamily protein [Raphanus sativus]
MPSGKYYCDYCEKEFQDTQVARKRHLQSNPHLRAKALWYSSTPSDVNNHQVSSFVPRGLCNRFVSSNFCPFGDSCRYLHPNNIPGSTGYTTTNNNNTQLLAGLPNQQIQGSSLNRDIFSGRGEGTGWFDLPPSLRPPPEQGYPQLPSIDWG